MSIKDDIAELEAQIAELRKQEEQGFSFETNMDKAYHFRDDHEIIYDVEGNFAGVVVNVAIMQKYMESLK